MINSLYKIVHKPRYFYNFQKTNWVYNQGQLEKNDLVLYLEEITYDVSSYIATSMVTFSKVQSTEIITKYKNFRKEQNKFKINQVQERFKLCKQEFFIFLTKDNQKTIVWKEFLESI